jgi:hypothetical protein
MKIAFPCRPDEICVNLPFYAYKYIARVVFDAYKHHATPVC